MFQALLERWQPFALLACFSLMLAWESFAPFFPNAGLKKRMRHDGRNLVMGALNALLLVVVFAGAITIVGHRTETSRWGLLNVVALPAAVHVAAAIVLLDIVTYWWHRFNHQIPFLWRFHRMHHSDPAMDASTGVRFHSGEIAISAVLRLGYVPLLGVPLVALVLYDLVLTTSVLFHHSNVALPARADRVLRYFLVSPDMHKVHHSRVRVETDSNYSSLLSVWDRVFGSYREQDRAKIRFGLEGYDPEEYQSIKGQLFTPVRGA